MPCSSDFIVVPAITPGDDQGSHPGTLNLAPMERSRAGLEEVPQQNADRLGEAGGGRGAPEVQKQRAEEESCGFQGCSAVLERAMRAGQGGGAAVDATDAADAAHPPASAQDEPRAVYVGRVPGGAGGGEEVALRGSLHAFLDSRMAGVTAVTYVCCVLQDPRIKPNKMHPRRVANDEATCGEAQAPDGAAVAPRPLKRSRSEGLANVGASDSDGAESGGTTNTFADGQWATKRASGPAGSKRARGRMQRATVASRSSVSPEERDAAMAPAGPAGRGLVQHTQRSGGRVSVRGHGGADPLASASVEESDEVEAREAAAEQWLASIGVAVARHNETASDKLPDGFEARGPVRAPGLLAGAALARAKGHVTPDEAAEIARDLLSELGEDAAKQTHEKAEAEVPELGGSTLAAVCGDAVPAAALPQSPDAKARASGERARGCAHPLGHQGYLLIQTNSSRAAAQALRLASEFLDRRDGGQGPGSAVNCSLGFSAAVVLAKAIRACRSRPQLVELLVPFVATSSDLVGDSQAPAAPLPPRSGRTSKAAAAVADTLKGARLDGETCALALRRLCALPVYPRVKPGESWHATLMRARRNGPQMPNIVDPEWRPRDQEHFRQQVVVAALLQRTLDMAKVTRTFALATVMQFLSRLRERYLELPGGFDWRYPRAPDTGRPARGYREYGWPGLTYQVAHHSPLISLLRGESEDVIRYRVLVNPSHNPSNPFPYPTID